MDEAEDDFERWEPEGDDDDDEWTCIGPDCCHPSMDHHRSECFTAESAQAYHASVSPCEECGGAGVVEHVPGAGSSTCDPAAAEERPCERCRPSEYARWERDGEGYGG